MADEVRFCRTVESPSHYPILYVFMRLLRVLFVAFLTAVAGCVLSFFVGDYLTQLAHVPDREGERGMTILFLCAPLGILVGLVIGIISAILVRRQRIAGFLIAQGWSLLLICTIAGLLAGIPYLLSDKPPRIEGNPLVLEFELRIPPQVSIPNLGHGDDVRVILYSGSQDFTWASVDLNAVKRTPEGTIIPGRVDLLTHNPARWLLAALGYDLAAGQRINLKLPGTPGLADEQWTDWSFATSRADQTQVPEPERFAIRYRVQPIN